MLELMYKARGYGRNKMPAEIANITKNTDFVMRNRQREKRNEE